MGAPGSRRRWREEVVLSFTYVALQNLEVGGTAYVEGQVIPEASLSDSSRRLLMRRGLVAVAQRAEHVAGATPTGGVSGDIKVGNGKVWVNDAGAWKSVAIS